MDVTDAVFGAIFLGLVFWAANLVLLNKAEESVFWVLHAIAVLTAYRIHYYASEAWYKIHLLDPKEEKVKGALAGTARLLIIISVASYGALLAIITLYDGIFGVGAISRNSTLYYMALASLAALAIFAFMTIMRLYNALFGKREAR
jgi:predicted signal transduction protein with EAL and GGDEF domain